MIDLQVWVNRLTWLFRLQFVVALAVFTYFTLTPRPAIGSDNDLFMHFLGNLLLFLSARLAMIRLGHIGFVLLFVLVYGAAMEAAQNLVPGRLFDPRDMLANAVGVIAGLFVSVLISWVWVRLQPAPVPDADDREQP